MLSWSSTALSWLDKRIPPSREFELDLRSIFIFPSRFGVFFILLCAALFLLGTNYQNNLMLFLCYFLTAICLLNLFKAYLNFAKLKIKLGKVHNVFAGDQLQLPLWISSNEPTHGQLNLHYWREAKTTSLTTDLDKLDNPVMLARTCPIRGRFTLPRITLNAYYPLGLFRCWTHLKFAVEVVVYPTPIPCAIRLLTEEDDIKEADSVQNSRGYDEFDSLKNFQPGEPLYHVAWKQFAKGQGMFSKQFSSSQSTSGWLKLQDTRPQARERQLGELCFQVIELTRRGQRFGLHLPGCKIEPDEGTQHQQACLTALALQPMSDHAK